MEKWSNESPIVLKHFVCGQKIVFGLSTAGGKIYRSGKFHYGDKGFATERMAKEVIDLSRFSLLASGFVRVSSYSSSNHVLALSTSGALFSMGYNLHSNLGFHNDFDSRTLKEVTFFRSKKIRDIFTGCGSSYVVLDDKSVYVFGKKALCGKTVHTPSVQSMDVKTPQLLDTSFLQKDEEITSITTGTFHAVLVSSQGNSFLVGDRGFGIGFQRPNEQFTKIVFKRKYDLIVVSGECTFVCTFFLTSQNEVLSAGCGNNGVLGHNNSFNQKVPTRVEALKDLQIVNIQTGLGSAAFVTLNHDFFFSGDNNCHSFGMGEKGSRYFSRYSRFGEFCTPTKLVTKRKIVSLFMGSEFSIFVDAKGKVLMSGYHLLGNYDLNEKGSMLEVEGLKMLKCIPALKINRSYYNVCVFCE